MAISNLTQAQMWVEELKDSRENMRSMLLRRANLMKDYSEKLTKIADDLLVDSTSTTVANRATWAINEIENAMRNFDYNLLASGVARIAVAETVVKQNEKK